MCPIADYLKDLCMSVEMNGTLGNSKQDLEEWGLMGAHLSATSSAWLI